MVGCLSRSPLPAHVHVLPYIFVYAPSHFTDYCVTVNQSDTLAMGIVSLEHSKVKIDASVAIRFRKENKFL